MKNVIDNEAKQAHFDVAALDALKEVMEDEFSVLVTAFIADSGARLVAMKYALKSNDLNVLRDIAHSFKGVAGNLCTVELAELCFKIEQQAREGRTVGLQELLSQTETEHLAVKTHLLAMIKG